MRNYVHFAGTDPFVIGASSREILSQKNYNNRPLTRLILILTNSRMT
jgi:hypothetical protein